MNFSCMIWPWSGATVDPVVRLAQTAEACGFESVYVGDSQMIWNDVWVTLGAIATATSRVMLGTGVTNTVTRHPAVTANAVMTLNMLSNGRAKLGLGAGDSAVRTAALIGTNNSIHSDLGPISRRIVVPGVSLVGSVCHI